LDFEDLRLVLKVKRLENSKKIKMIVFLVKKGIVGFGDSTN